MEKLNKKILIVEDDDGFRILLEERFSKDNFVVFTAKDGEEGLFLAEKEKPDLILSDVLMPKMNGIDMAKMLRERNIDSIIMFLTNLSDMSHISDAVQANPSDYIIKTDTKIDEIFERVTKRL